MSCAPVYLLMTKFSYKAKRDINKVVEGHVDADNVDAAVSKIISMGYSPVEVNEFVSHDPAKTSFSFSALPDFSKKISRSDISIFTRQVSDLIDAGISVLRALVIVAKQIRKQRFKNIIEQMRDFVEDGGHIIGTHWDLFLSFIFCIVACVSRMRFDTSTP